jgi:chitin disaccharide deacetylase
LAEFFLPERISMKFNSLWLCVMSLALVATVSGQSKTVAERLGHPADSKLLIIHADDLAVAHAVDSASFDALDKGAVTSASILIPCPWLTEVADYAKAHPDADLGLHLDLTSEWNTYRWGPVESKEKVPSLLDPAGTFWNQTVPAAAHAKPEEAERELRAQIEHALAMGIHPTHLDTHMGAMFAAPALTEVYARVAHQHHLPFLAARIPGANISALSEKDILLDSVVIASPEVQAHQWKQFYLNAIKNLKPGLTEMTVHLGKDDAELQAIMGQGAFGSSWRQRDYEVVTSPEFKKALEDNHIVLVKWRDLGKLVQ